MPHEILTIGVGLLSSFYSHFRVVEYIQVARGASDGLMTLHATCV